ncbi:hypothetical protein LMG7974_01572 [Campylobacter majalis]|uniref:Uncharacterized protein n=1 Tax=Campylobacter majalis TaxID=2790656 RepID=A0ABN7KCD3_9BACT|nr:hypothetical protein [Campylobacter majalis]CAD7289495.1 hypothetical protein LMG7974_01572 [Campylobacter majalis]
MQYTYLLDIFTLILSVFAIVMVIYYLFFLKPKIKKKVKTEILPLYLNDKELKIYDNKEYKYFNMLNFRYSISDWQNNDEFKISLLEVVKEIKEYSTKLDKLKSYEKKL